MILCIFHREHRLQRPLFPCADRHHLTDILIHDNHTCSMSPQVSIQIFQLPTELKQTLFIFTTFSGEDCQFRLLFKCLIESDIQIIRNKFCYFICFRVWEIQYPRYPTYNSFSFERTKSGYLTDIFISIFFTHMLNHFFTTLYIKINIKIRQTDTVWI